MADILPAGLTWTLVSADIAAFYANAMIISAMTAILAIKFAPKVGRAIKSIVR